MATKKKDWLAGLSHEKQERFLELASQQLSSKDLSALLRGKKILKAVTPAPNVSAIEKTPTVTVESPTVISYACMLELLEPTADSKEKFVATQKTLCDHFGFSPHEVPAIIACEWEIARLAELGGFFLYLPEAISMEKLNGILAPIYQKKGWGKVLYDTDWYGEGKEGFYTTPIESGWMSIALIPADTGGKDFLVQTELLVSFVCNELYKGRTLPEDIKKAVEEFKQKKKMIRQLIDSDQWSKSAEILAKILINKMFCPPGPAEELLFSAVIRFQTGKNIFEVVRGWTRALSRFGSLVFFGDSDVLGARVNCWVLRDSNSALQRFFFHRFSSKL